MRRSDVHTLLWIINVGIIALGNIFINLYELKLYPFNKTCMICPYEILSQDRNVTLPSFKLIWIDPLTLAKFGFAAALIICIMALLNIHNIDYLYAILSTIVSLTLIPFLIFLELIYNYICPLCSILQIFTLISSILAVSSVYIRHRNI